MKGTTLSFAHLIPMPASASPSTRKGFDYTGLDIETSQFVQQQTGEIRVLMKRTAQGIVEIGLRLIEVKEKLGHGRFGDWLEAEFDWTWKTATRFMSVAEHFNFDKLSKLDFAPSALYILASPSTPKAVREEALARAEAGEPITYTIAKAIKQKYATPPTKPQPQPEPQPESVSLPQPSPPTPAPPRQSHSKLEIVAIRPPNQAPDLSEAAKTMLPQATPAPQVPQPTESVSDVPGVWWQLGGRHLLYCGNPHSPEFLKRIPEKVGLLLAFPPTPDWHSTISAEVRLIMTDHLPHFHNPNQLDEALESIILLYSRLSDLVVGCFVPSLEIVSIINRLDRRSVFAEPDKRRVNAITTDWKKAGLKAERVS